MKDKHYMQYWNLGLSIAYIRKSKGLTQQQLAEKMEVSCETISRMENANTGISTDMLFELSEALEIPLSELFAHAKL